MASIKSIVNGLNIFANHIDAGNICGVEAHYEQISIGVEASEISLTIGEKQRLEDLGWMHDQDDDNWFIFA